MMRQRIIDAMNPARNVLRILIPAATLVALSTGTAIAQFPMPGISLQGEQKKLTPEEQERQKAIDNAYRSVTAKIPEKRADDPWADVRPAPPAPAPKKKQQ